MDVILSVRRLKGKVRIAADGGQDFLIPHSVYRRQPLSQGDILDLDAYFQSLAPLLYRHALDHAVKYLSVRARSCKEVETKLRLYGYPDDTVKMVLFKLEQTELLDDSAFAVQWTQARCEKGLGKKNIARTLRQKGISSETVQSSLQDVDDTQQLIKAKELIQKWLPRYRDEDSRDAVRKLMQALVRRGYDWEIARKAVGFLSEESR